MALINLGKIDKNLIPLFIGCIFCLLNRFINQYENTLLFDNVVLTNIFFYYAESLVIIIPLIIIKIRSKKVNNNNNGNINNNDLEYIYRNPDIEIMQGRGKYIILFGVIFFVESFLFVLTFEIKTNSWIFYILLTSLFYYLIFKVKLYKHHYISVGLIIIIGLIIDLAAENLQNDISNNISKLLLSFLKVILLSLNYVIIKYIMETKFCSFYGIALYEGIINSLLYTIFFIFDYYYFKFFDYEKYFNNFDNKELLVLLGVVITQIVFGVCTFATTKNYSPCHVFIIFVFGQLAYYINFSLSNSVIVFICLIFIFFLSLIFNEIIEINIWGLSYNTKRNIINRAKDENEEKINIYKMEIFDENDEINQSVEEFNNIADIN